MNSVTGKKILITGATGSLGRALIGRLSELNCNIIAYSRDESKHARFFSEQSNVLSVIGDVRDYSKVKNSLDIHKPDFIIHAAALKRIDDMEFYPDECIKTNIEGSNNIARAAIQSGIEKCILISTDKACQPVNVYGSSKFIAERLFSNYDYNSNHTIFSSVRYGNVIASTGSFVPLFIDWINAGQKIKVTSSEMTRFLFTLDNAVDTVISALENSIGGEVFVPQISSYTLPTCIKALEIITNKKAKTTITGLRPGEKLHEDMLAETELPFTYKVKGVNLLQVRPQYTVKEYQSFEKYEGPHFNSSLWVSQDVSKLVSLISSALDRK